MIFQTNKQKSWEVNTLFIFWKTFCEIQIIALLDILGDLPVKSTGQDVLFVKIG